MSDRLEEAIIDCVNAVQAALVNLKRNIGEVHGVGVREQTFLDLLGWEASKGERLGDFEFTSRKANNNSDAFNRAYTILKVNGAAINKRFHDEGFRFSYWLYGKDRIYRQVLKK